MGMKEIRRTNEEIKENRELGELWEKEMIKQAVKMCRENKANKKGIEMDIKEIREHKEEIQKEIAHILAGFEGITETRIEGIRIVRRPEVIGELRQGGFLSVEIDVSI